MTSENLTNFTDVARGKRTRNSMRLPELYFVAMDDWIIKIGEKSFMLWLRLYTMADRTVETREKYGDHGAITYRQSKLIDRLGMSKTTFNRQIKPLYEYGFVDLLEYKESKNTGQKPVTVVVYSFPCNDPSRQTKPLEKVRSWEQRTNEKYNFTTKGGRPKGKKNRDKSFYYNWLENDGE